MGLMIWKETLNNMFSNEIQLNKLYLCIYDWCPSSSWLSKHCDDKQHWKGFQSPRLYKNDEICPSTRLYVTRFCKSLLDYLQNSASFTKKDPIRFCNILKAAATRFYKIFYILRDSALKNEMAATTMTTT